MEVPLMITVHYDSKPIYNIVFGKNFEEAIPHLKELGLEQKKVCIVSDSTVAGYYLKEVEEVVSTISRRVTSFVFPAGAQHPRRQGTAEVQGKLTRSSSNATVPDPDSCRRAAQDSETGTHVQSWR